MMVISMLILWIGLLSLYHNAVVSQLVLLLGHKMCLFSRASLI